MPDNEELCNTAYARAYEFEQKYGSCPQCVLAAVQETLGGISDDLIKASQTLAGGSALVGAGTCGALAGGMLAIGAFYGRERQRFDTGFNVRAYRLSRRLYDQFISEFGSPLCRDVQVVKFGKFYDLWDRNEYQAFEDAGGHVDKCPDVAGKVARWTLEILLGEDAG